MNSSIFPDGAHPQIESAPIKGLQRSVVFNQGHLLLCLKGFKDFHLEFVKLIDGFEMVILAAVYLFFGNRQRACEDGPDNALIASRSGQRAVISVETSFVPGDKALGTEV